MGLRAEFREESAKRWLQAEGTEVVSLSIKEVWLDRREMGRGVHGEIREAARIRQELDHRLSEWGKFLFFSMGKENSLKGFMHRDDMI